MDINDRFLAIVIAAGLSSRMGGFKPLMDVGGKPVLLRLLDTIYSAGIGRAVVVTGYGRKDIEAALAGHRGGDQSRMNVVTIFNSDYESGMFGSIQTGIRCAVGHQAVSAALLFPVDVPLVSDKTITGLIRAWDHETPGDNFELSNVSDPTAALGVWEQGALDGGSELPGIGAQANTPRAREQGAHDSKPELPAFNGRGSVSRVWKQRAPDGRPAPPFAVPVYQGRNGHPLLIPREYFGEILNYKGEGGLKGVRAGYDESMIRYETDDRGCVLDMDTAEDYRQVLEHLDSEKYGKREWRK